MKILMITGDRALAVGKRGAFYNTLEEFSKHWDRIDIICPKVSDFGFRASDFSNKVRVHSSPWPLILQPFWILKIGQRLFHQNKFDLVTCHDYPPFYNGLGARLLWNKIRIPYVLEVMHIPGYPRAASVKESIYKLLMKFFIAWDARAAKAVRVINQHETPEFLIEVGVPREKIVYMPAFYIDLDVFKPANTIKKYDLIFVGRLEKNKGLELLLKAIKLSVSNYQFPIKCLIVGDGPLRKNLELRIKNQGLGGKVLMHGYAKDSAAIARLINESRALIMLSDNEGGPRVVLEALACGVPVIATPVGIVPDVINKSNGRIVNWSADEVIKAFQEIKDMKVATDMAQFERKAAIKNYANELKKLI